MKTTIDYTVGFFLMEPMNIPGLPGFDQDFYATDMIHTSEDSDADFEVFCIIEEGLNAADTNQIATDLYWAAR